jgi:hypothetical protein
MNLLHTEEELIVTSFEGLPAPIVTHAVSVPRRTARDVEAESNCAWALRAALLKKDASACCLHTENAARLSDTACVPLLSEVLLPPQGFRMRLHRRQWTQARLASIRSLAQIGSLEALSALARAILDPSPLVQDAAAKAILPFGPEALPALTSALHTTDDWPVSGMKRLVTTIGQLRAPQACAALVPVVLGGQPLSAARWDKPFRVSFNMGMGVAGVSAFMTLVFSGSLGMALAVLILSTVTMLCLWMLIAIFCIAPYSILRESYERGTVANLAAEGVRLAGNKAYLPAVVEGAFGYNRMSPKPARKALLYLLPLLNAEDGARMDMGTRRQLMDALGHANNSRELELALLQSMEWVGTGQAVRKVEWLARRGPTSAIRDEAARILPLLEERRRQEQAPATLLRASSIAPTHSYQLLRPVHATDTTPIEQLLRPGNTE